MGDTPVPVDEVVIKQATLDRQPVTATTKTTDDDRERKFFQSLFSQNKDVLSRSRKLVSPEKEKRSYSEERLPTENLIDLTNEAHGIAGEGMAKKRKLADLFYQETKNK